ncbi:hypothetical protein FOZ63_013084 [Perkinsus olseni]|uniref:Uncharacterized protein n=1 Tax=Perkinsus olseni TaxID=32597 RepID=A0A7J6S3R6_PEROL|nr:hypothetical protein FOZ63_013084 [Perkinsus olseni]
MTALTGGELSSPPSERRRPSRRLSPSMRKAYHYKPAINHRSQGLPERLVWHSDGSPSDRNNRYSSSSGRGDSSPFEVGPFDLSPTGKRLNLARAATYIGVVDRQETLGIPEEEMQEPFEWSITAVGSYSCHRNSTASDTYLVVPGLPPVYFPPETEQELQLEKNLEGPEDVLMHFDLSYPLRAARRVIDHCTPDFDWSKVDLVTNRGTLCDLLRFIGALTSPNQKSKPFEFPLNGAINGEPATVECSYRHHTSYREYKNSFKMAMTTNPPGSEGLYRHHRFSLLKLGHLNVVVRAEVDAIVKEVEDNNVHLHDDGWKFCDEGRCAVWTQEAGVFNPNDTTVELKCRTLKCPRAGFKAAYYQMALGDSDKLAVGRHQDGHLVKVEEFTLAEVHEKATDNIDKRWAQLGRLLEELLDLSYGRLSSIVWNGKSSKLIVKARRNEWA